MCWCCCVFTDRSLCCWSCLRLCAFVLFILFCALSILAVLAVLGAVVASLTDDVTKKLFDTGDLRILSLVTLIVFGSTAVVFCIAGCTTLTYAYTCLYVCAALFAGLIVLIVICYPMLVTQLNMIQSSSARAMTEQLDLLPANDSVKFWEELQGRHGCCGLDGPGDWDGRLAGVTVASGAAFLPISCCPSTTPENATFFFPDPVPDPNNPNVLIPVPDSDMFCYVIDWEDESLEDVETMELPSGEQGVRPHTAGCLREVEGMFRTARKIFDAVCLACVICCGLSIVTSLYLARTSTYIRERADQNAYLYRKEGRRITNERRFLHRKKAIVRRNRRLLLKVDKERFAFEKERLRAEQEKLRTAAYFAIHPPPLPPRPVGTLDKKKTANVK